MEDKELRETLKAHAEELKGALKETRDETRKDLHELKGSLDGIRGDFHAHEVASAVRNENVEGRARAAHHRLDTLEKQGPALIARHEQAFHTRAQKADANPAKFWGMVIGMSGGMATAIIVLFKVLEAFGFFSKGGP